MPKKPQLDSVPPVHLQSSFSGAPQLRHRVHCTTSLQHPTILFHGCPPGFLCETGRSHCFVLGLVAPLLNPCATLHGLAEWLCPLSMIHLESTLLGITNLCSFLDCPRSVHTYPSSCRLAQSSTLDISLLSGPKQFDGVVQRIPMSLSFFGLLFPCLHFCSITFPIPPSTPNIAFPPSYARSVDPSSLLLCFISVVFCLLVPLGFLLLRLGIAFHVRLHVVLLTLSVAFASLIRCSARTTATITQHRCLFCTVPMRLCGTLSSALWSFATQSRESVGVLGTTTDLVSFQSLV